MKTILSLLALVGVLAVAAFSFWPGLSAEPPRFRTLPVVRDDLLIAVGATGTVEPVEIVDVGAQIVGSIQRFGLDEERPGKTIDFGSHVKQGDVLAQLDDSPHQAELDRAKANLKWAESEVQRFRVRRDQARRDVERAEQLLETISVGEWEGIRAEFEIAEADLAMSNARLEQAAIAARQAEINLGYTLIRAPVDGVVLDRRVNVGQTVVAGLNAPSLFLLAKDLRQMLVWAAVNEADIGDIRIGQKVNFKVDAFRDRTFTGTVSQIRLNASLMQNVVTYGVVIDVDNTDEVLMPYMTAKVQFEVARRSQVLLVPNQALRWRPTWEQISPAARAGLTPPETTSDLATNLSMRMDGDELEGDDDAAPRVQVDEPTVWVLADDGLVRPVAVKTGLTDGLTTEVAEEDLEPGMAVVVNVVRKAKPDFVSSFVDRVTKGTR
jgi:HlyD family secretion protein